MQEAFIYFIHNINVKAHKDLAKALIKKALGTLGEVYKVAICYH